MSVGELISSARAFSAVNASPDGSGIVTEIPSPLTMSSGISKRLSVAST